MKIFPPSLGNGMDSTNLITFDLFNNLVYEVVLPSHFWR